MTIQAIRGTIQDYTFKLQRAVEKEKEEIKIDDILDNHINDFYLHFEKINKGSIKNDESLLAIYNKI